MEVEGLQVYGIAEEGLGGSSHNVEVIRALLYGGADREGIQKRERPKCSLRKPPDVVPVAGQEIKTLNLPRVGRKQYCGAGGIHAIDEYIYW